MHPCKFFNEVGCRTGVDVFEIFDNDLKEKLKNIHPKNFIKTKIIHPVYEVEVDYFTENDNYKRLKKIMVLDSPPDDEYSDFWADMFCRDYAIDNPEHKMHNLQILNIEHICDAVLPIG